MFFRLNAPSGTGCFLASTLQQQSDDLRVLMRRLVLGAFWPQLFSNKATIYES